MTKTLYTNGRFFDGHSGFGHMDNTSLATRDLRGKLVLPAFVDAHCHLMMLGESLEKVDVFQCKSMNEVITCLQRYQEDNPTKQRILARNWMQNMDESEMFDRKYIDERITKPVYIMSFDLHSCLCNSAALKEIGIDESTPDPSGGELVRTVENGKQRLTGWLKEMACINFVAPTIRDLTSQAEKEAHLDKAFDTLLAAGYTAVGDLLMEEEVFAMLASRVKRDGRLPIHVSAYWHCSPEDDIEKSIKHIIRAKELQQEWQNNEWLQVKGIKLVVDGVIDSCTATLSLPYQNGSNAEPLWPFEKLQRAIKEADKRDLQCAIHAIGDEAVHITVKALSSLGRERIMKNRHRIEHLELTHEADVEQIGVLNITASIQPVHSDPEITQNWFKQLGGNQSATEDQSPDRRCCRAFAYNDFLQKGAPIAIGTDAPTAPFWPLPNLYNAHSRCSALNPSLDLRTTPQYALPLLDSVLAASNGAAKACHLDHILGDFAKGKLADFNILDIDFFAEVDKESNNKKAILRAKVVNTFQAGIEVAKDGKLLHK
ncbi:amidohydrolase 3 [Meira miltonrushii]|uniref:Amidohydrolase 3 n=1 Tax=Meira miltonrushii TaxID=1280837 RepID=A0A316VF54_9BASI|nr:amidohydrolase 3 [Meira miltonrushii]PWN34641.1 amidohydrolase 3 [Meira miltonrushii]